MPYLITGIISLIIGVLLYIKSYKIKIQKQNEQKEIQEEIERQKKEYQEYYKIALELQQKIDQLEQNRLSLHYEKSQLEQELYTTRINLLQAKEEVEQQLLEKEEELSNFYSKIKSTYDEGYNAYSLNMDKAYEQKEKEIQLKSEKLQQEYTQLQQQRNQIQNKIAQTQEYFKVVAAAKLKEQEAEQQREFYKLQIPKKTIQDIELLQKWKSELHEPTIVSKIIWSSYVIKPAGQLCNKVLGSSQVSGIYKITNILNDKVYIGQSVNIADRWKTHIKYGLGIDTPSTNKLYTAMQNDGVWNFTFQLLEKCTKDQLNKREQYWINLYQSNQTGYNSTGGNKDKT